ncbi:IS5 family transposase [Ktedonobacter racemifer]|uniref:IS5 family transposase n=1 Tax=Ktedonobacter racemifer TaxID=363277 RepID=UPI0023783BF1|nr:IS5 family transposase [Ktedonobacter racemifer]
MSDEEWAILEPLIPPARLGGRPRAVNMREIVNAILYILRSGCQWRMLPREFPPWSTVWTYFRTWCRNGSWERMHTVLREAQRKQQGREPPPSAAILDSQTVKTSQKGGPGGYDGGKKINGRKRQVLVDTLGLILHLKVHTADVQDRAAVAFLQGVQARYPRLEHVWVDQGYTGSRKTWIEEHLGWSVTVVQHPPRSRGEWVPIGDINDLAHLRFEWRRLPPLHTGFRGVLPRRWVVERTFAWLTFCRRLCKDYEFLPESSESWIYASQIRLLLRRLARAPS